MMEHRPFAHDVADFGRAEAVGGAVEYQRDQLAVNCGPVRDNDCGSPSVKLEDRHQVQGLRGNAILVS